MNKKIIGLVGVGLLCVVGFSVAKFHGEYDHRDLPSKIKVTARASEGYYIHASVLFEPSNPIYLLCTGVFGEGLNEKKEFYNDIPSSGVDVAIKNKWSGICRYQFVLMGIACTKTKTMPDRHDGSFESTAIGILDTTGKSGDNPVNVMGSPNPILKNSLNIRVNGSKSRFWGCDSNCESEFNFGITHSTDSINVVCKEQ